jgi:hypothetical protein
MQWVASTARRVPRFDQAAPPNGDRYFEGARLLVTDTRVALLLLAEARDQAVQRVFGVPRDKSVLVSIIALGMLAGELHSRASKVSDKILKGPNPSLGDAAIGTAMAKTAAHGVAGEWSRDSPLFGTLLVISALGVAARPVTRASFRDVRAVSHRVRVDFQHRYGHLIRRNHPRRTDAPR